METARETSSDVAQVSKAWFEYNKDELMRSMEERNRLLHLTRIAGLPTEELKQVKADLRRMQSHIDDESRLAMGRWAEDHATKLSNMAFSPRLAWQSVYILAGGDSAHHKNIKNMLLRKADGELAKNDDKNAEILEPHFKKVFNNKRDIDWEVLDEILQRSMLPELDDDISSKSLKRP